MAEPEERLRDEEDKLGSKVVVREEEQEARVRLDSQVDERRESEEDGLSGEGERVGCLKYQKLLSSFCQL